MSIPAINIQDAATRPPAAATGPPAAADGNAPPAGGNALPPPPAPSIEQAVKQIQDFLANSSRQLQFQVDETTGRTIIRVTNPETGEVIRQIPSEEVLRISASLRAGGFHMISEIV